MSLLESLRSEAIRRGLAYPTTVMEIGRVYTLVRDMAYQRASDRRPETIIAEWRGTCSGKHYLLKELFDELGYPSQVMACTTITPIKSTEVPEALQPLYLAANRRFVDVHNYLLVRLPQGSEMLVDATWPLAAKNAGLPVNEQLVLGKNQRLAAEPLKTWPVPPDRDPQDFKNELLQTNFTPAELEFREIVIQAMAERI